MNATMVRRRVNPKLGAYFGIFASAYVCLVLLALIGDQLGAPQEGVRWSLLAVPLLLYAVIGVAGATRESLEYFAAGRRVPAVYSGLTLAFSAFGGTGLIAITGALFLLGFDALCLVIGGLSGFVVMGILLAPFIRKFGAYTLPTYLGRRFESPVLRVVSALIVLIPLGLMLTAELKMAAHCAAFLTGLQQLPLLGLVAAMMMVTLVGGGVRALTWSSVAQSIAALLALIVPVTIVAVMWTNLPLPQLSHGPMMRVLARQEALQGLPLVFAQGMAFDLPGHGLTPLVKRYAATFSTIGPTGFVAAVLTLMMGVAAAPWLLPRIATAPGVYQARKSLGWATVVFGLVMLTATSIAVFCRALLLESTMNGVVPDWVRQLASMGYASVDGKSTAAILDGGRSVLSDLQFSRDIMLFALPIAGGLSPVFSLVAAVGGLAACLTGASAAATAIAATLAEDVVNGAMAEPPLDPERLSLVKTCLIAAIGGGGATAALLPGDSLDFLLGALTLTGSAIFPVLVLSIWWKRTNAFGAVAGLASGFGVALLAITLGSFDLVPFDPALAGIFGIPSAFAAAIAASLATPSPSRHVMELVRDIRVPGGEILYDREMRLLRLKKRQRTADPL